MLRSFFNGFVKLHILHHASTEPVYGAAMMEELKRHGYDISPGTLYPTLHSLEGEGYLESNQVNIGGKIRRYYTITPTGKEALFAARPKIRELFAEILGEEEPYPKGGCCR